jgi:hypothetical protein
VRSCAPNVGGAPIQPCRCGDRPQTSGMYEWFATHAVDQVPFES